MNRILVSAESLQQQLSEQPITILRALMSDPINGTPDIRDSQLLPGTIDFDIDAEGSDHSSGLPHTNLSAGAFSLLLGQAGITADTDLVIYDNRGIFCAPRLWWMMKALGHDQVRLLDGGWPAWEATGTTLSFPVPAQHRLAIYSADVPEKSWFVDAEQVSAAINTETQIVDARSAARFNGEVDEPRAGVRQGHIPGSLNLPFQAVLENGKFKDVSALAKIFADHKINLDKPIICSCGSGVTACIIGVAALLCGATDVCVYDGAWSEWGANSHFPVEV